MHTISSSEARSHFGALLDRVEKGEEIAITRRGITMAILVPEPDARNRKAQQAIHDIIESRKGQRLDGLSIRELIDEGRR